MEIIRQEQAVEIHGMSARAFGVVANSGGRIVNQKIGATRYFKEGGRNYRITVQMRFDDECRNGHETFSITGNLDERHGNRFVKHSGGCIHEEIAKHFPELAHLIKWHLVSTDGPMHYVANTTYHASNRNFDAARSCAVWPDATDEQLSQDKEALKAALLARLPELMAEFKTDMQLTGFVWPEYVAKEVAA